LFFQIRQNPNCLFCQSAVHSLILKLKKKSSSGVDSISERHMQLAGPLIEQHVALLFQMILIQGVVPMQFCVEQIAAILKKGKKKTLPCAVLIVPLLSCVLCLSSLSDL
jgi:hypothetical protein